MVEQAAMTENDCKRPKAGINKLNGERYPRNVDSKDDNSILDRRRENSSRGAEKQSSDEFLSAPGIRESEIPDVNPSAMILSTSEIPDNSLPSSELSPSPEGFERHQQAPIAENMHTSTLKSYPVGSSVSIDEDDHVKVTSSIEPSVNLDVDSSTDVRGQAKASTIWTSFSVAYFMYLSAFAITGSILRVFCARLFGDDCESRSVDDFLTPLSTHICITASGRTLQTGGALFIDLPANMIGSFVMGIVTPSPYRDNKLRIPWFRKENPIQSDDVLHSAFTVGFCGSLTTFASWNSQMVVMMDGKYTKLGSQVLSALLGYFLGMVMAIESFKGGRHLNSWIQNRRNNREMDPFCSNVDIEEEIQVERKSSDSSPDEMRVTNASCTARLASTVKPKRSIFLLVAAMLASFVAADAVFGIRFYRELCLICLMSPAGALLRWSLSQFNNSGCSRIQGRSFDWVPWGTLTANVVGAIISIVFVALGDHVIHNQENEENWKNFLFGAMKTGFAGSLSTVSSMVKEVVLLSEKYPGSAKSFRYAGGTTAVSMILSICLYSAIVRLL